MFLHSRWWVAHRDVSLGADKVAAALGGQEGETIGGVDGSVLFNRGFDFSGSVESDWEQSQVSGTRWIAVADVPDEVSGTHLIGILAATPALAADLGGSAETFMQSEGMSPEPASFSMRQLLDSEVAERGFTPKSVRLTDDVGTLLVQSDDEAALRSRLAESAGEISGVTVETAEGERVTVVNDGTVIFANPRSTANILQAVRHVLVATTNFPLRMM